MPLSSSDNDFSQFRDYRTEHELYTRRIAVSLAVIVLLFGTREQKLVFLIFWAGKIGVEKRILQEVLATFRINLSFYRYVGSSFLHPIYVVLVGILAIPGKYSWKGRNNRFNL